jgi:hypothetical protein
MMSRRAAGSLLAVLAATFLAGCASPPKKDYTAFHAANPHSILVVPVVNNTINVEAPGLFLSTLPIPVAERGYYVFPVAMVKGVLEEEGLSDPNLVHGADTARLCNLFGADAVLYVSIEAWTAKYIVINTQVTVEFDYVMKDGKTGETIWKEHHKVASDSSQGARDPLSPLVMAVIAKAYPNYMPLARSANSLVLGVGLPAGPRHKNYGKAEEPGK